MIPEKEAIVWLNNEFVREDKAKISISDRGILYGDGVFTTMRAEEGRVFFLDHHLERISESCRFFRIRFPEVLKNHDIYKTLLVKNDLEDCVSIVKIIVTRGNDRTIGLPECDDPTCIIMARQYHPPDQDVYDRGWSLVSFSYPRASPLSEYKTLNYLYNLWARQYAIDAGADEALLIDPGLFITETATGTVIVKFGENWFTPMPPGSGAGILPGITLKILSMIWKGDGISITPRCIGLQELKGARDVWILNSLMGVMPVRSVDGTDLPQSSKDDFRSVMARLWRYAKK